MRHRCNRPAHPNYHHYGGRGIRVHPEWDADFAAFVRDVGFRPSPELTLERRDNERGYEPGNVYWAPHSTQANNRRNNHILTCGDKTQTASQWARELGLSVPTLFSRLAAGWTIERIIATPRLR
jgi:hypothetical protein